jgi:hypothetical protein
MCPAFRYLTANNGEQSLIPPDLLRLCPLISDGFSQPGDSLRQSEQGALQMQQNENNNNISISIHILEGVLVLTLSTI